MPVSIEYILLGASALLVVSIALSKVSGRLGVPALLVFILLGILAGSEGPGGIYFDDAWAAQFMGVVALALILFSGGLDTEWASVRPVLKMGLSLATLGVLISTVLVGWFATLVLGFSWLEGLLLGAIVSSTDAGAVFAVLRSRGINLKPPLRPLIELESGSNDPMAVFLTIGLTGLLTEPGASVFNLVPVFFLQMALGGALGYLLGRAMVFVVNRIRLDYEGLYPVLTLSLLLLVFAATASVGGSGFLAVYIAGLVMGNSDFVHKRSLMRFHDGLAWLMQIAMFLTLGLLVFPSRIVPVIGAGVVVALFLVFVARPASVFGSLLLARIGLREKAFVGWVGLRGAVPIVLATFPLLARLPKADLIFNLVFFIVLFSVLLQGTSLSLVARWLGVEAPPSEVARYHYPLEFVPEVGSESRLLEVAIPAGSPAVGRTIMEMQLPRGTLFVLVSRDGDRLVPTGSTVIQEGDRVLVLTGENESEVIDRLAGEAAVPSSG